METNPIIDIMEKGNKEAHEKLPEHCKILDTLSTGASIILKEKEEVTPMFFFFDDDASMVGMFPANMNSEENKDICVAIVKKILNDKKDEIKYVALVAEAWVRNVDKDVEEEVKKKVSEQKDKKEALLITIESSESGLTAVGDIVRDERGKPTLGKVVATINSSTGSGGRFSNLFQSM